MLEREIPGLNERDILIPGYLQRKWIKRFCKVSYDGILKELDYINKNVCVLGYPYYVDKN